MRDRWKKIREALRIVARYKATSKVKLPTVAEDEQQVIISVSLQVIPFRATHSHGSSVPVTRNKALHRFRLSNDMSKPLACRP
jgi:hypothetical protein